LAEALKVVGLAAWRGGQEVERFVFTWFERMPVILSSDELYHF